MKERPMIFTAGSVQAILEGSKTQTRRVVWRAPNAPCRYGVPGDRLWVKETWDYYGGDEYLYQQDPEAVLFRADECNATLDRRWRTPLFMPRWASRITLEITEVRSQRLQDISEDDARAEGVERDRSPCDHTRYSCEEVGCMGQTFRSGFCDAWCLIHGDGAWESNPTVWAISFRTVGIRR